MTTSTISITDTSGISSYYSILFPALIPLIVAFATSMLTIKYQKINNNKDDVKMALEMAKMFADEIIPLFVYLSNIFKHIPNKEILNMPSTIAMENGDLHFDIDEFDRFEIQNKNHSPLLLNAVSLKEDVFKETRAALVESSMKDYICYNDVLMNSGLDKRKILIEEYATVVAKMLNTLEYFSMNLNKGIAKEDIVYQSLHQVYRSTVLMLYFDICIYNNKVSDKYYTNVIALFNHWNSRHVNNVKCEEELHAHKKKQLEAIGTMQKKNVEDTIIKNPMQNYRCK